MRADGVGARTRLLAAVAREATPEALALALDDGRQGDDDVCVLVFSSSTDPIVPPIRLMIPYPTSIPRGTRRNSGRAA